MEQALFLLLLTVAAITPAVLRGLALVASRFLGRFSPIARLASGDIAASLSRTGVAVAALGLAIASMIGVSIMVESFRESLRTYLDDDMPKAVNYLAQAQRTLQAYAEMPMGEPTSAPAPASSETEGQP